MYEKILAWQNLLNAFRKAALGKRGKPYVAAFEHRLEDNLIDLSASLRDKTYRPGAYTNFYIHEPKKRLISAAPFRDRVVHHALCNVIEPIYEKIFINESYANRKNKGTHRALNRAQQFARRYRYALKCDIRQFFPSIDHTVLKKILSKKIKDPDVMELIGLILKSGEGVHQDTYDMVYFPDDDIFAINRPRGLPIGNLTSQFWANVYLNPFDYFINRELSCTAYLRYVDDFLLFSDSKKELWSHKRAIEKRLMRFRVTMHPCQVQPTEKGIPFLGFIVFPQRRKLKNRKGFYFERRLRQIVFQHRQGDIPLEKVLASISGWANHVRFGNTVGLRESFLSRQKHLPIDIVRKTLFYDPSMNENRKARQREKKKRWLRNKFRRSRRRKQTGVYFFTLVTYDAAEIFRNEATVDLLKKSFKKIIIRYPFKIVASVLLPNHMHCIWIMPWEDQDYALRWRLIKDDFTMNFRSKVQEGIDKDILSVDIKDDKLRNIWQRGLSTRMMRNRWETKEYIERIHMDPVWHNLVNAPINWPYSSFHKFVRCGIYDMQWGSNMDLKQRT